MLKVTSKPEEGMRLWDWSGGYLFTAPVASGMKRARARSRLWYGTGEPVVLGSLAEIGWGEGVLQAAETVRSRVPIRSTGADRPVVVMKFL